jgi:curli biogenesis system outer membrane secretion channel CsgG
VQIKRSKLVLIAIALTLMSGCATQITAVEEISSAESISIAGQEVPQVTRVIALANGSAEIC